MKKLLLSVLRSLRNFCFPSASGSPLSSGFRLPGAEGAKVSQKSQKIKFKWAMGCNYSASQSRARARRSRRNCAFRLSSRSTLCHFGSIGNLRKFCFLRGSGKLNAGRTLAWRLGAVNRTTGPPDAEYAKVAQKTQKSDSKED